MVGLGFAFDKKIFSLLMDFIQRNAELKLPATLLLAQLGDDEPSQGHQQSGLLTTSITIAETKGAFLVVSGEY